MTDEYLEEMIAKSRSIGLVAGFYGAEGEYIPGYISLAFNKEDVFDAIDFFKFIKQEFSGLTKKAFIKQVSNDSIDLTLLVEREPAVILISNDMYCPEDRIKLFLRSYHRRDKPIYLLIHLNWPPDTPDNTLAFMKQATESGAYEGMQIHFWDGTPIGT